MMNSSEIMSVMELLDIKEVTTKRQRKNGTREFKLPIKHAWGGHKIRVASFKSGYVRVQNCGYTAYQLNKRVENQPTYYKDYKWVDGKQVFTGKYQKFTTRGCNLIPIEIDRLEYLISYCLKNYYIKHANFVADGGYVPKWYHEYKLKEANKPFDCGHYDRIRDLEDKLDRIKTFLKHEL